MSAHHGYQCPRLTCMAPRHMLEVSGGKKESVLNKVSALKASLGSDTYVRSIYASLVKASHMTKP